MNRVEAEEYAKQMTYRDAVCNALSGKFIPYRKATLIKLYELLDLVDTIHQPIEDAFGVANEAIKSTQSNASNVLNALDCVSKQAVIKAVDKHTFDTDEGLCLDDDISCILEEIPSAQPERKTGRWILWNYPGEECAICSACGEEYDQMELYIGGNDYPKFCPECGARMEIEG